MSGRASDGLDINSTTLPGHVAIWRVTEEARGIFASASNDRLDNPLVSHAETFLTSPDGLFVQLDKGLCLMSLRSVLSIVKCIITNNYRIIK